MTPIVPEPLTEAAASALAGSELGQSPTPRFSAACHRVSSGNPFLIVEMLRALAAEQTSPSDENADRLEEIAAAGVSRSILARLTRLGDHAVEIARAVSVLEPNAEVEHVAVLAGVSVAEAADASSRLIDAHLLADRRPLTFVHPLVRSAVYTDMPEPTRAQMHAGAAKRLGAVGGSVDSIAGHLMLAPPRPTRRWWSRCGPPPVRHRVSGRRRPRSSCCAGRWRSRLPRTSGLPSSASWAWQG